MVTYLFSSPYLACHMAALCGPYALGSPMQLVLACVACLRGLADLLAALVGGCLGVCQRVASAWGVQGVDYYCARFSCCGCVRPLLASQLQLLLLVQMHIDCTYQ